MKNCIEFKNVYKSYPSPGDEVKALKDINLTIKKGELLAITGSSGSGKSTLMNILGCLDTPTTGSYFLEEKDVSLFDDEKLSKVRNKKIGFVFQGFHLIPGLTALENVELPLIYRGFPKSECKNKATEALGIMGLSKRIHHLPSQMSGGQQQRVAIARAIIGNPPIILADEPTGNLDSFTGKEVMDLLLKLHRDGKTVIIITHDKKVASYAENIIKISDGRII